MEDDAIEVRDDLIDGNGGYTRQTNVSDGTIELHEAFLDGMKLAEGSKQEGLAGRI